ncbi:MAG: 3-dehydroquinate synthase, partial [Pseudomonadota bacterium]
MSDRRRVRVDLAGRAYDIEIGPGLIDEAGALIKPLLARPYAAVLADAAVVERHGDRLKAALAAADIRSDMISVRPGE